MSNDVKIKRVPIGVSDMKVSDKEDELLITFGLASCGGVTIYDPVAKVGGLLHVLLPDSSISKRVTDDVNPFKFVDTGIPLLFKTAYQYGAKKSRLIVSVVGCSSVMKVKNVFNIGQRNYAAIRKILWKNNIIIDKEYCRTNESVTLSLNVGTGDVVLKIRGTKKIL